ncbi:hypothetical protein KL928_003439 [Ogataea angusta]|uniref:DNA helicase n=1 Tax=Pichia angusta TaxID=870730 RepID=A0AAN6I4B8_PICAN|nr:uncharacterized protein KL928_003439 [Ogataea angusta]KAG7817540.1 hypothetical protein KL928_003439 [Ogataea angusta]
MSQANVDLSSRFLECLAVERQESFEQTSELLSRSSPKSLSANGLAVLNLSISNVRTGVGGKQIVELVPHSSIAGKENAAIQTGDLKIGDIVKMDKYGSDVNTKKLKNSSKRKDVDDAEETSVQIDGVVVLVGERQINIALNYDSMTAEGAKTEEKVYSLYNSDAKIWLVQVDNEITYNRMESTMRKLGELDSDTASDLVKLVLGKSAFIPPPLKYQKSKLDWFNDNLNNSQRNAVQFSLASNLSIIHGPPGTGKTSTIVELVKQMVLRKRESEGRKRILICGPSNISIDTILERLSSFFSDNNHSKLVRIGHPARMLPQILRHSLDIIAESESGEILKDILQEINQLTRKIKKSKSYRERRELYQTIKELKKDLRLRSKKAYSDVLSNSEVVAATLHGSSAREAVNCIRERGDLFDTIIIDEVSQALEPSCWIPLIYHQSLKQLVIAGDNKQLSPTIKTQNNAKVVSTLSKTLFDRLIEVHKNHQEFTCFLDIQYRMNKKIMSFFSDALYDGKLIAHSSVENIKLSDLPYVKSPQEDNVAEEVIWYDTQGGDFPEADSAEDDSAGLQASRYNDGECLVVLKHVRSLVEDHNVKQGDIGIISPYSAQVSNLRRLLREETEHPLPDIEISTVDGFQGREKEVIILSLVRSNDSHDVGFLNDHRRMNVSISRAKRQLCVVGDMETISESNVVFLKQWCEWCEENADIRYVDVSEL